MTLDPLKRYGVSPKIGKALYAVLDAMAKREGCKLPSSDVIEGALKVLGADPRERGVSHRVTPATIYKVPSASKPGRMHMVALYMQGRMDRAKIIDAECSCEATTACRHLLVALTYAEHEGYNLETNREEN